MSIRRYNPYVERVRMLEAAAIEACYRVDVARQEYETALLALARGVEKMQWVNSQMKRDRAIRHEKRRIRKQIYTMRKAG